jgi:hypothetical protein
MIWRFYSLALWPLDLIHENLSTFKHHVDPATLGGSDYFTAVSVRGTRAVHVCSFTC